MTTPDRTPDPWSVVEHHARQAVTSGDGGLSAAQRLAMYVAVAPALAGARAMSPREARAARAPDGGWVLSAPNAQQLLGFDASGNIWVTESTATRRAFIAAAAFVIATALFTRIAGPRAVIAGLIVGAGVYAAAGVFASRWRAVGDRAGDDRHLQHIAQLAARYEAEVAPAP